MTARSTRTTCPYCGVGCGVLVEHHGDGEHAVRGDPVHPANAGRLCSKGTALTGTLDLQDRLLAPQVDGQQVSWDRALDVVAAGLRDTMANHGADAVALYVSGQLLTEDYYVANKFVKGWLGTANIDTNSRLCMASSVAAHKRAFGSDTVPGLYNDLELADLVVLVGSNLAWCHPVLYQRLAAARAARPEMRVVLIDPRRTATAELADLHLPIAPDTDLVLFGGLVHELDRRGEIDHAYVAAHVAGLAELLDSTRTLDKAAVASATGLAPDDIDAFYSLFRTTPKTVSVYSQGINQGAQATDSVNAIINCHLVTGRIGKQGAGPFSITGQPNAMGGREVGGLANQLAAHVDLADTVARDRVQAFWGSPRIASTPGPKAVELFERVADGRIKAIWVLGTNPVDSLPDAGRVRQALIDCPLVVVSDVVARTDTTAVADVLLPACAWSEKDGTVTNSERRISRQRAFRDPCGQARPDWWQIAQVAARLGWGEAFDWQGPAAIFREHAALSEAAGSKDFDIGAATELDDAGWQQMTPFQWPWRRGDAHAEQRFFGTGRFNHGDGRARLVPLDSAAAPAGKVPASCFTLNTGRVRDQWHTMTRTGRIPALGQHLGEPFVEMAPSDAQRSGIGAADIVEVSSSQGVIHLRVLVTSRQQRGSLFVPMHWTDAWASSARVDTVVAAQVDPISGQPASKSTPVRAARWPTTAFAFVLCAEKPAWLPARSSHYWAVAPVVGGWRIELATTATGKDPVAMLFETCRRLLADTCSEVLDYRDPATRDRRQMHFEAGRLVAAIFVAAGPVEVARHWAARLLGSTTTDRCERYRLLAARPSRDRPDGGAIVCSCHGVGIETLRTEIRSGRCASVAALGSQLQAGTNCGSCRPELAALIASTPVDAPVDLSVDQSADLPVGPRAETRIDVAAGLPAPPVPLNA